MNKSICPSCKSHNTIRYGTRKGVQTYKCNECGYRFRNYKFPSDSVLWEQYQSNKQTVSELARTYGVSESTIKRHLKNISFSWKQPLLSGGGYVHLDVTYWGHNWGVMLAMDDATGSVLYIDFINSETNSDYETAVKSICKRGFEIRGLVIDGKKVCLGCFPCIKYKCANST